MVCANLPRNKKTTIRELINIKKRTLAHESETPMSAFYFRVKGHTHLFFYNNTNTSRLICILGQSTSGPNPFLTQDEAAYFSRVIRKRQESQGDY